MKKISILLLALTVCLLNSAQSQEVADQSSEKAAVKEHIERFLKAAGDYDIEAMRELFSEQANIGGASYRNGEWKSYTMSIGDFLDMLAAEENPAKYTEPVSKYSIHMDHAMLAFVKADAILHVDGKPKNYNYDYFTLIKVDGQWTILNGSYVSVPIEK